VPLRLKNPSFNSIMTICKKCGTDVKNCYDCEHTEFEEYCKECYTELHYYMTEKENIE
jgi:hypothetical protein